MGVALSIFTAGRGPLIRFRSLDTMFGSCRSCPTRSQQDKLLRKLKRSRMSSCFPRRITQYFLYADATL